MNNFICLDLTKMLDCKMVYDEVIDKSNSGIDDNYILSKDFFRRNIKETFFNIDFVFNHSYYDNILCDSQKIVINRYVKKIYWIGFTCWCENLDFIKVTFEDLSIKEYKIFFMDVRINNEELKTKLTWMNLPYYNELIFSNISIKKVKSYGTIDCFNFHLYCMDIDANLPIKNIVLPDNMFMHIFAITLEE